MANCNQDLAGLPRRYLFAQVAKSLETYRKKNPDRKLIDLSVGDVKKPLPPAAVEAMRRAVGEMSKAATFRGYGPEVGYGFLREAVAKQVYGPLKAPVSPAEIFISDGVNSDCTGILDIFSPDNRLGIQDPVYPVYRDAAVIAGRAGRYDEKEQSYGNIRLLRCSGENGFLPEIPRETVDVIYLCFPNNPTGAAADRAYLKKWVDYALERSSVLLFDGAYEAYITEKNVPHSIYEIPGAESCAIEFRSFSKTAGFTGVRCGYTVVPEKLKLQGVSLNELWRRRVTTKFNGVSYITQRGAEGCLTPLGEEQCKERVRLYLKNAARLREGLLSCGLQVCGGVNAPYLWCAAPGKMGSEEFFNLLLNEAGVAVIPGAGFGCCGEGFVRFHAFCTAGETAEAVRRIRQAL